MVGWGKHIFNYHPEWLSNEVNTLNRALGYNYKFTSILPTEPGNALGTSSIVARSFDKWIVLTNS